MEKKRILWIDALNILACAGVLLLHCTNTEVHNFKGIVTFNWCLGVFTHSFFIWPVDVFFMLSGYTLLRKSVTEPGGIGKFFHRRLQRLLIPVLGWNILNLLMDVVGRWRYGMAFDSPSVVFEKFFSFQYNGFMWFFVPLICLYLTIPFLAIFVLNARRETLRLYLLISLLLYGLASLHAVPRTRPLVTDIYLFGTQYLPFAVAGYYLGNFDLSYITRKRLYTAAWICIPIMIVGLTSLSLFLPERYGFFNGYTNIPCTIVSYALFVYFKYTDWGKLISKLKVTPQSLAVMSSLSLGIYLVQHLGFKIVAHINILKDNMILTFIVMYISCSVAVWLIKKVPFVNRLI